MNQSDTQMISFNNEYEELSSSNEYWRIGPNFGNVQLKYQSVDNNVLFDIESWFKYSTIFIGADQKYNCWLVILIFDWNYSFATRRQTCCAARSFSLLLLFHSVR